MNVIITGASKGIGKAIAESFATEGHQIIICARNAQQLQATVESLNQIEKVQNVQSFVADLSKKEDVKAFVNFCLQFGAPDILVNNAGVYIPGNIYDEKEGNLELMMNTNLYSAYHLTRYLLPSMMEAKKGHVFNICSIASLHAYQGGGGYSISKFAMDGFSKNLRHELKNFGIKVTSVYPGAVMTDSWGDFDNSDNRIMESSDIAALILAASKLSLQAVVEEIVIRPQLGDL